MRLTRHAERRIQQRALPGTIVDLLGRYGREVELPGGRVVFFDRRARERAREDLTNVLRNFDRFSDAYLVQDAASDEVITVGHRFKRIRRK